MRSTGSPPVPARLCRRQDRTRMARFRRPDRRTPVTCSRAGDRAMGAVPARWRDRPHPRRRGAGHQPRAMGHRQAAGRGFRRRAGRAGGRAARSSSSATRNSRSIPSRAPIPEGFDRMRDHFETGCAASACRCRRPTCSIPSAPRDPILELVDRSAGPTADGLGRPLEHKAFFAERPGAWTSGPSSARRGEGQGPAWCDPQDLVGDDHHFAPRPGAGRPAARDADASGR
jgi:hypothetical protein